MPRPECLRREQIRAGDWRLSDWCPSRISGFAETSGRPPDRGWSAKDRAAFEKSGAFVRREYPQDEASTLAPTRPRAPLTPLPGRASIVFFDDARNASSRWGYSITIRGGGLAPARSRLTPSQ